MHRRDTPEKALVHDDVLQRRRERVDENIVKCPSYKATGKTGDPSRKNMRRHTKTRRKSRKPEKNHRPGSPPPRGVTSNHINNRPRGESRWAGTGRRGLRKCIHARKTLNPRSKSAKVAPKNDDKRNAIVRKGFPKRINSRKKIQKYFFENFSKNKSK